MQTNRMKFWYIVAPIFITLTFKKGIDSWREEAHNGLIKSSRRGHQGWCHVSTRVHHVWWPKLYPPHYRSFSVLFPIAFCHMPTYFEISWTSPFQYKRSQEPLLYSSTPICPLCLARLNSASDSMRIERFLSRTVWLGYLPEDCSTFHDLVNVAEDRLLSGVIANPDRVQLPLFLCPLPPLWSSNVNSSIFSPPEDDMYFIPRVLLILTFPIWLIAYNHYYLFTC